MNAASYADRLCEIIKSLPENEQKALLEDFEKRQFKKIRKNERKECLITVNYAVKGRAYQNYIQDISTEGVFIETRENFSVGDEILLTISYSTEVRPFKIAAEVVRINPTGVGVKFKKLSQVQAEIIKTIIKKTGEPKKKSV
ncbi:MAG: PilZ domain-containing protein [Desulfobacterales bacterium]|nr:PilZ domain-containing protein [Desulfobacterales bacterium]